MNHIVNEIKKEAKKRDYTPLELLAQIKCILEEEEENTELSMLLDDMSNPNYMYFLDKKNTHYLYQAEFLYELQPNETGFVSLFSINQYKKTDILFENLFPLPYEDYIKLIHAMDWSMDGLPTESYKKIVNTILTK